MKYLLILAIVLTESIGFDLNLQTNTLFKFEGEFKTGEPMGIPIHVSSFSDGSFVLYEHDIQGLKVFDKSGNLIDTLSRRGRGPGELIEIDHIFVDNNDQLLVVDHVQVKLSLLNRNQKPNDHFIFESRPRVRSIHQKTDGSYILASKKYWGPDMLNNRKLYHFMSNNFQLSDDGIIESGDLSKEGPGSLSDIVMSGSTRLTDNSVLTINDDLVVAPMLYNGEILVFENETNYVTNNTIQTSDYGPAYEEYPDSKPLDYELIESEGINMVSNQKGRKSFYHFNKSLGLFRLNSGEIIHFVQIQKDNRAALMVEFLDREANDVLRVQELEKLGELYIEENIKKGPKHGYIELNFHHVDKNNRLYVSRFGDNHQPELHVIQLDITTD